MKNQNKEVKPVENKDEQTAVIENQTAIIEYQRTQIEELTLNNDELQTKLENQKIQVILIPLYKTAKQVGVNDLRVYLVELSEPEFYVNSDKQYDHYLLITKRGYEVELPPVQMPVSLDDGVQIVGQVAKAWYIKIDDIHWEIYGSVPVFVVAYSQADVDEFVATAVDAKAVRTLMERVYASMYLFIKNKYNCYDVSLDTETKRREAAEDRAEKVVDDLSVQLGEINASANDEMDTLAPRLSKKAMIGLGAGWGVAVVLLGILLGVLM